MDTLLDAHYRTEGDKAVIELFYAPQSPLLDKDTREIRDFQPYFYALPAANATADDLLAEIGAAGFPHIAGAKSLKMTDLNKEVEVVKVTLKHPRDVPELRVKVAELKACRGTREDDIRFVQRYVIDAGIIPMAGADNSRLRVASFDTETIQAGGKTIPIIISYADNNGLRRAWNYQHSTGQDFVVRCPDEKEMIKAFIQTVKDRKIDVLVTYNGDNYDFGVLKDRCKDLGIEFSLGADGSEVKLERRGMDLGARVIGRPHIDMYPVCRRMFSLPRYTLEDVHLSLFEEEKLDIEVENMAGWWAKGENTDVILSYAQADADSCLQIALEVLPIQYELAQVIGQPLFEVSRMGTGNAVEWLLMRMAHEKKILVPAKPGDGEYAERRLESYEGAYVVEPDRGIHDNILVFDFRSLYPSIIIAHNIDPATINCECCKGEGEAHVSPTGARFCKKHKGLIPELLEDLLKSRGRAKLELKKLVADKGDKTKIKSLDARQQAMKILANSAYGYMGFSRARWYNNECAGSVAAWGRDYIKKTIKSAEEEGYHVVYGDTDSLMLTLPHEADPSEVMRIKNDFLSKINKKLPQAMELEFQGYYPRGVFVTKKRYALIDRDKKLTIKGLETRRRDWANIAKIAQESVLYTILWENNPKKAAEFVKGIVADLRAGKVPLKDLVISTQLTKNISEYENVGPHVLAAKKAQKMGKIAKPGDLIQYIIAKKGASISDKAVMVGFADENDYDAEYYIDNQVLPAVMRILEALGYQDGELKGQGRQMKLGGF